MPPPPAPTARSSSRSSKRNDAPAPGGGRDESAPSLVAVGEIVAAHALNGVLRFRPYQPPAPSLVAGATVYLEDRTGRRPARVVAAAPHGRGAMLLTLEGVADRNGAEALVRARVLVPADALAPAAEDEFYWHEIVGFRVDTTDGRALGEIVEVFNTGLNDVWTVHDGAREYLIPVIADVVRTIDRDARRAVIEPMPGLLE
jgi:16S rRNA processing protein RimM